MTKIYSFLLILTLFALCCKEVKNIEPVVSEQKAESEALKKANENFTYLDKAISPKIIQEFCSWESDPQPQIMSIDITAATNSNRFFGEYSTTDDGEIFAQEEGDTNAYFQYKWIGKLDNGVHVIHTSENGGGTGVYEKLLFTRFSDSSFDTDGNVTDQLLMTLVKEYCIGDRNPDAQILLNVKENKVSFNSTCGESKKVEVKF